MPPDHPLRLALAAEAHARPPEPVRAPARARYVAVLVAAEDRPREIEHLAALCAAHGVAGPAAGATHHRAALGALRLKWERHGEFSGYTWIAPRGDEALFAGHAAQSLPPGWLAAIPGRTVAAVDVELVPAGDAALDASGFEGQLIGADIAEGAAAVATDFQLHDGCTRFLLVDRRLTERQAGRMLQRLFEIEAYRILALLALPIARELAPRVLAVETALARLTGEIARGGAVAEDESLLHELSRLAAEVESGLAASQYRFGACEAYCGLVMRRIAELRESRLPSQPTIEEFMTRRFTPAVATCRSVQQRLADLSERVARASALLATRVGIARERQSQDLLTSMDQRAKLQLRLQQTVEGLSIAAIAYYVSSLFGHLVEAADAAGWFHVEPAIAVGVALPVIVLAVVLVLRRARRHLEGDAGH
ncbi:MAG: DUF3422 domain-containing protein [Burkholderiales bacterium]|nr:DUF3422 domain-containing protein [Burkholderiales bacterium]